MKPMMLVLLLFSVASYSHAEVGLTLEKCNKEFGEPVKASGNDRGTVYTFRADKHIVTLEILRSRDRASKIDFHFSSPPTDEAVEAILQRFSSEEETWKKTGQWWRSSKGKSASVLDLRFLAKNAKFGCRLQIFFDPAFDPTAEPGIKPLLDR